MASIEVYSCRIKDVEDTLAAFESAHLPDFVNRLTLLVHAYYFVVAVGLLLIEGAWMLSRNELGFMLVRLTECHGFGGQGGQHIHEVGQGLGREGLSLGVHLVMDADDIDLLTTQIVTEHGELTATSNSVREFADDDFIATSKTFEHIFPHDAHSLVMLVFNENFAASVVIHPLDVGLQVFFKVLEGHDISYSCHGGDSYFFRQKYRK